MKKDKKEIIASPLDPENPSLPQRSLHQYEYKNNQMLSDVMFAASGMGVVVLLSHSIRLLSASSKQTISKSTRLQIEKAHIQAREIGMKLGIGQKEVVKKKVGLKQSL